MIEEEDDEEILRKSGITVKSALKNLLVIGLIVIGAIIMYVGVTPDQWLNLFIGFMFICFGTTVMQIQSHRPDPIRQTLTILICSICGLTKVRNFESGDFVFHKTDKCDKCNDSMEIKQIYSVRLKKQVDMKKKQEKSKLNSEIKK